MLRDELPVDDANKFLQSAYACGRRIYVTEVGKQLMLKVQNSNNNTNLNHSTHSVQGKNGELKQKQMNIFTSNSSSTKMITKQNILKRISPEELTKLCGDGKVLKTVCNTSNILTNGSMR